MKTTPTKIILGVLVIAIVVLGLYLDSRPVDDKGTMMDKDSGGAMQTDTVKNTNNTGAKTPAAPVQKQLVNNNTIITPKQNPLGGTEWTWQYTTFGNKSKTMKPASSARFVIKFTGDGKVTSTTDCNSLSGTYSINKDALHFGPFATTLMACTEATMEAEYSKELAKTGTFTIVGPNELHLNLTDSGVMVFLNK